MLIAKIENNQVVEVADYRDMFKGTSFPSTGISDEFLVENNCKKVTVWKPYDPMEQKLVGCPAYIENNEVFTVTVELLTPEDKQALYDSKAADVRKQRDNLLAVCDWTQLPDSPVNKTIWANYRQELRDVTNQPGFPFNVIFPTSPDAPQTIEE
jgi:hypothetical protein